MAPRGRGQLGCTTRASADTAVAGATPRHTAPHRATLERRGCCGGLGEAANFCLCTQPTHEPDRDLRARSVRQNLRANVSNPGGFAAPGVSQVDDFDARLAASGMAIPMDNAETIKKQTVTIKKKRKRHDSAARVRMRVAARCC